MSQFRHMTPGLAEENALLRVRVSELERAEVERREAEAALRESRARLRSVVGNLPVVLFALDRNGVATLSEGKGLEGTGFKPGQAVGLSVFEIYKDNPQILSDTRRALAGESFTTITEIPGLAFETRYIPLRDAAGEVSGVIGVGLDITDRLRAEKALRASEERFRMLAENIPGVIYLCRNDARYSMLYLNDAVERLTGFPKQDFLEDRISFADLFHPDDAPQVYRGVDDAVAQHRPFHLTYRLRRKEGGYIWVEEHGAGVFREERLEYLEGYIHDISQRMADQRALEEAKADLERRVEQRTENLRAANEKARRTQDELAHVLRVATVGEMATGLAHELNQPLSAMLNYIQGARRRIEAKAITQAELVDAFEKVAAQAERAGNILRTVRRYITRRDPAGSTCDLIAVVRDALELAELAVRERQVRVELSLPEALPAVEADAVQIGQVVMNLLRNGIEAMDAVPAAARLLRVTARLTDGHEVETVIRDSGPGIPAASAASVFDPFFSTKRDGLGMGLSISRSIIEAHHGRIWLAPATESGTGDKDDAEPRGAEFHFTLPVKRRTP